MRRRARIHVEGAIELGEPPPRLAGTTSRLVLRWSKLRLDDLVPVLGQSLPIRSGSLASGSATVDFDARVLETRAWSRLRAAATTTLQPAANASSRGSLALSGRADLQLDQASWSLPHSIQSRSAQIDLAGNMAGRLLDGAGGLHSTLGGRSRLRVADISAFPSLMQPAGVRLPPGVVEGLAGSMRATVDLAGTLQRPRAQIDLAARDLRARLLPRTADLDARLAVDATAVHAQSVRATAGTTSLRGSGRYSWRGPFDARVELGQGDLSEIARQFRLPVTVAGSTQLEATISGTLSSVTRRGQAVLALSARDLAVEQIAIGPVAAKGTLTLEDDGLMTVDATAPGIGARARFEIVNRSSYPVSGDITLDHDDIGTLIPPRYRQQIGDVSGKVSARARGSGHLSDPGGVRGRIDLRELDLMALGTRLDLAAPGSITLADDRIAVDALDLRVGQRTHVTLGGQLGVTALPDTLRFHLDGPLSELIGIGARAGHAEPVPVRGDGTATLDVAVQGTLGHPLLGGSLMVRSPSLEYGTLPAVTSLALDATIDPTLITLRTLAAQFQGASLSAEGAVPWRVVLNSVQPPAEPGSWPSSRFAGWLNALPTEPARARLTLRAENVTQAALEDIVASERLQKVQGSASATVAVDADRFSFERAQATAVLDRASLTLAGVPFTQ